MRSDRSAEGPRRTDAARASGGELDGHRTVTRGEFCGCSSQRAAACGEERNSSASDLSVSYQAIRRDLPVPRAAAARDRLSGWTPILSVLSMG